MVNVNFCFDLSLSVAYITGSSRDDESGHDTTDSADDDDELVGMEEPH